MSVQPISFIVLVEIIVLNCRGLFSQINIDESDGKEYLEFIFIFESSLIVIIHLSGNCF